MSRRIPPVPGDRIESSGQGFVSTHQRAHGAPEHIVDDESGRGFGGQRKVDVWRRVERVGIGLAQGEGRGPETSGLDGDNTPHIIDATGEEGLLQVEAGVGGQAPVAQVESELRQQA